MMGGGVVSNSRKESGGGRVPLPQVGQDGMEVGLVVVDTDVKRVGLLNAVVGAEHHSDGFVSEFFNFFSKKR